MARPEAGDTAGTPSAGVQSESADDLLADANPRPKQPYRDRKREQKLTQREDEHSLRKVVAGWAYAATAAQIVVADTVFVLYAWKGVAWNVPTPAIAAWLSATVVQVIAVVLVITRYLFPPIARKGRGRQRSG